MQPEVKRLIQLSKCMHLNKTDRDAILWALEQIGEIEQEEGDSASPGYPDEFEWLWSNYPNRSGSQGDKRKSIKVCEKRLKEGEDWKSLARYMKAYEAHCKDTDKLGTEFVMQFQKFFGDGEHYKADWSIDNKKSDSKKSAAQALTEMANNGSLYQDRVGGYLGLDGKMYESYIAWYKGEAPIE